MRVLPVLTVALLSTPVYADDAAAVAPPCALPARLEGVFDGAPGYFVGFKKTTADPRALAAALAKKYGFEYHGYVSWTDSTFVYTLSPVTLAKLRCEPDIEYVEFDRTTHI